MNDLTERKKISLASILSSIEDSGIQEVKDRMPIIDRYDAAIERLTRQE